MATVQGNEENHHDEILRIDSVQIPWEKKLGKETREISGEVHKVLVMMKKKEKKKNIRAYVLPNPHFLQANPQSLGKGCMHRGAVGAASIAELSMLTKRDTTQPISCHLLLTPQRPSSPRPQEQSPHLRALRILWHLPCPRISTASPNQPRPYVAGADDQ